jgi:hypothetical protein
LNKSSQECKLVCLIKGELAFVLVSFLSAHDDDDDADDADVADYDDYDYHHIVMMI